MKDSEEFRIHYTPGEKRAIISMFRAGMKLDVLLDEYGVLPQTLMAWVKEFQCEKERVSLTLIGWIFGAKTWKGTRDRLGRFFRIGRESPKSRLGYSR